MKVFVWPFNTTDKRFAWEWTPGPFWSLNIFLGRFVIVFLSKKAA